MLLRRTEAEGSGRRHDRSRERAMQWLHAHGALVILLLCTAVVALRLLWPPLGCWLVRLLVVVLFSDHLPEVITDFECDPSRYLDLLQEPPM